MTAMDILTGLAEAPARSFSQPSRHAGMGAVLYDGGVAFRVWAPNALSVAVAGDFNGWSAERHPLMPEEGGIWSADVEGGGGAGIQVRHRRPGRPAVAQGPLRARRRSVERQLGRGRPRLRLERR